MDNMGGAIHILDAPFRTGVSGKYKLQIKKVVHKSTGYEYDLADSDGREYKATSIMHYAESNILRCMVSFEIIAAKLVVSEVNICKKQDLCTPIIHALKEESSKALLKKRQETGPESGVQLKEQSPLFAQLDMIQEKGRKRGPMTEDEVKNIIEQIGNGHDDRRASYHCCGKTYTKLFDFRKHLFECHIDEYRRFFVVKMSQHIPDTVRGVGVKRSFSNTQRNSLPWSQVTSPTPCTGDYFRLIYTPMGKK